MKAREVLENDAKQNSWSHAYLFIGGREQANEALVGYFVKARNISGTDVSTVRPSSETGKKGEIKAEEIRRLIHDVNLSSAGNGRLAVIYNCEKLNESSASILLKTLEEPPGGAIFVLFSANWAVLPTIVSRCRVASVDSSISDEAVEPNSIMELKCGFAAASKIIEKIVKEGNVAVVLESIELYLRQKLLEEGEAKYAEAISSLHRCRHAITGNANPRLALESLVLSLEEVW